MIRIKPFLALVFLLAAPLCAAAQGITLSLNVSARPNPYLSEWEARRETAMLTVTNLTGAPVQARISARVFVDGVLKAETETGKMPLLSIGTGVSLFLADEIVPGGAVKFYGNVDEVAQRTGMLPAGAYEFCVTLLNAQDEQISGPVCRLFTVTSYQLPTLLQPGVAAADAGAAPMPIVPGQRPVFRWTPIIPTPPGGAVYRVLLFEILPGQKPMQAFRANQPIMDVEVRSMTQLVWPADVPLPDQPGELLWSVQTLDLSGRPLGDGPGFSEPFLVTFRASSSTK